MTSQVIFFDIDGVLTIETEGFGEEVYADRTPNKSAIPVVNRLYKMGHQIVLWTARFEEDREVTMNWLRKHGVKYHTLIMDKPYYDLFIDDKGCAITSRKIRDLL